MHKNIWYLKKKNYDNFNLSMAALDSAYDIEQLIKNKNILYEEDLKKGISLLELIKNSASKQINNSNLDDELLNNIVSELTKILSLKPSELVKKISGIINDIKSNNYNIKQLNFFIDIYNAIDKVSSEMQYEN